MKILGPAFALAICLASSQSGAAEPHPLDPLSADEITATVSAIAASGKGTLGTRAAIITLRQPDKADIFKWQNGGTVPRRALAVLSVDGVTTEAVVNLTGNVLESWTSLPGAQTPIHSSEWAEAVKLVKADPRWQAAMAKRGYRNYSKIFCESYSAGYFADPAEEGRRLIKMPCYDITDASINIYARPIEGVTATVDLAAKQVIDVHDDGITAREPQPQEFKGETFPPAVPSDSTDISLNGRTVLWKGWSFHVGFDQRFGPVLSLLSRDDEKKQRSVIYQAHVSEVFVPYMDESHAWSYRTFLDAGEFGLGALTSSLRPGLDCPQAAIYFDATLSTPGGGSFVKKNVMCVFEQDTGAPLWRHSEALNDSYEGLRDVRLVLRSIPSVAHYDYIMDWVFAQSGEISMNIGATGIDAVKAGVTGSNGSAVTANLTAVDHDHFFSVRLDIDIDGPTNQFTVDRLSPETIPQPSRRKSLWTVHTSVVDKEGSLDQSGPAVWRVVNPVVTTGLGLHPAYQIEVPAVPSLLSPEDWPQKRGAFSAHPLWITRYKRDELFAAGPYPNQSPGGGLPDYTDSEDIADADLVAWATLGFHHVTRPEDWPVLSTQWLGLRLKPFAFFDRNPSALEPLKK